MNVHAISDLLKVSDDGKIGIISKRLDLLVDHKSEDSEHGSTPIVQLNGTFGELGVLINVVLAEENVAVAEVVYELVAGSFGIAPEM